MSKKTNIKLDEYEKGLLITAIARAISNKDEYSPDDIAKLLEMKTRLQSGY